MKTCFTLGCVGSPFGLKGFVKVKSYSGETSHFSRLKKVRLKYNDREETREVEEIIFRGGFALIRFIGIDTPEAAGTLKGAEIIAGREYAAPLNDGEFYVEDLKGLEVINRAGKTLGNIVNLLDGGGGSLAELKLISGLIRLVPFRMEFFGDVNLKEGKIELLETWILE